MDNDDARPFSGLLQRKLTELQSMIAQNKEALVTAWIAQTGLKPDESAIVQQMMPDGAIRMWVERRGETEELQRFRKREALVKELLEAADELGDELYPILSDHDWKMRQNYLAAKAVRDFKVTP